MIVQDEPAGRLRIVLQPDHAAQCGRIAERWRRPRVIPEAMWPRFLTAVRRHDDGWQSVERLTRINEAGRPFSFRDLPNHLHHDLVTQGIETVARDDAYAAILVARHFRWLADRHPKSGTSTDELQRFIASIDERVAALLEGLREEGEPARQACEPDALDCAQQLLSAIDGLSLMLNGGIPLSDWPGPLAFGDGQSPLTLRRDDQGLRIAPWPFAGGAFIAPVVARVSDRSSFPSAQAFAAALDAAAPMESPHRLAPLVEG